MDAAVGTKIYKTRKKVDGWRIAIHSFFIFTSIVLFIIPLWLVISISLTTEEEIFRYGFQFIPNTFSTIAYSYIFSNMRQIVYAYAVTAFQGFAGTFFEVLIASLCAYSLSRAYFRYKKHVTWFLFITMIFSGGLVPSYILITQYLRLADSIWVYIIPSLVNVWFIIVFRTFFQGLPDSLAESAKMDGASEFRIYAQIIIPLSKPVLATAALLILLGRWNVWFTTLLYIRNPDLYTLQFLLHRILTDAQAAQDMIDNVPPWLVGAFDFRMPLESLRYAMAVIAAGPMLFVFPFFQKYFSRGLIVGAVKG